MGKKKGKGLKNNIPSTLSTEEHPNVVNAPHSFVLHRGLPCPNINNLTRDYRRMMEPFTASALRERKNNKIKDFLGLSGLFHVSHMCVFNKAKSFLSFKTARLPRGPTLSFKVHQFTMSKDVIGSMRRQFVTEDAFKHSPLVILNNFTGEGKHLKLMANTFQNMFPTINLATIDLTLIKRCVLYSYNPVTNLIDVRHYVVTVVPIELNRGVKKVVLGNIPNLAKYDDISEFVLQGNAVSDSEFEDDETGEVCLPQTLKKHGNIENNKSCIKLHEVGPRLTIELMKIEEGLFTGECLYHKTIIKTEAEIESIKAARIEKHKLKIQRQKRQMENKMKNDTDKEMVGKGGSRKDNKHNKFKRNEDTIDELPPDDDAAYYKDEVGEEPDEELFNAMPSSRKRPYIPKYMHNKNAKKRKMMSGDSKKGGSTNANKKNDNNKKFNNNKLKFDNSGKKKTFNNNNKKQKSKSRR